MKRPAWIAAMIVVTLLLPSCGLAKGVAQTAGRTLQSVGRLVTGR